MERIRKPDSADFDAEARTGHRAKRRAPPTSVNRPGRSPPGQPGSTAMYPYPPQPPAYPQALLSLCGDAATAIQQPAMPQPQQAYPPQYAQPHAVSGRISHRSRPAYPYPPRSRRSRLSTPGSRSRWPRRYGRPQPVAAPYAAYPMMAPQAPAAAYPQGLSPAMRRAAEPHSDIHQPREMSPIEEVRESLREFRDAIRELTESRARRSF